MEDCVCVKDPEVFGGWSRICRNCPWYLVAGALAGKDFGLTRQEFMRRIIEAGHTQNDRLVVRAISEQYGTNMTAAALSFRRARRKWRLKKTEKS